jgi:hypothetical protein
VTIARLEAELELCRVRLEARREVIASLVQRIADLEAEDGGGPEGG